MSKQEQAEQNRDKSLKDSFPASDPPASSAVTGAESPDKAPDERNIEEVPTGLPTSDRHSAETAHHWEHEVKPGGGAMRA